MVTWGTRKYPPSGYKLIAGFENHCLKKTFNPTPFILSFKSQIIEMRCFHIDTGLVLDIEHGVEKWRNYPISTLLK